MKQENIFKEISNVTAELQALKAEIEQSKVNLLFYYVI